MDERLIAAPMAAISHPTAADTRTQFLSWEASPTRARTNMNPAKNRVTPPFPICDIVSNFPGWQYVDL